MPEDQKKTYIGVKRIEAYPAERDGQPGYAVIYPDGYKSWSPKAVFEAAYFPIKDGRFIQEVDIQAFINASKVDIQVNPGQVMAKIIYPTGFADAEATASSDVERFDERIAASDCMHEIRKRLWTCMLFVMDWATDGLKAKVK